MTTHDKDKIIAAAKEAGFSVIPVTGSIYLIDGYKEAICTLGVSKLYAIAFEDGRQAGKQKVEYAEEIARRLNTFASRDAEIATLRDHVKMLRDAIEFVNNRIGFSSTETYRQWEDIVEKALAATEPKE